MEKSYDGEDLDILCNKLIGLGEQSFRKSNYSELQERFRELERFKTLLDQSNDAIFLLQIESKTIVDVNESACIQLEYSCEELLAMEIDSFFQLPGKKRLSEGLLTANNKDKPQVLYIILPKKNGGQIPAEVTIRMVVFDNTNYAVAVARDISERRQAEQKLQEQYLELQAAYEELSASYEEIEALSSEVEESYNNLIKKNLELTSVKERLELVLWGTRAGMWEWYAQTGKLFFDERYIEIYGYESGELSPELRGWEERLDPEDSPYVQEKLYSHIEGKTPCFEAEYRIKNKKGEWIWVQNNGLVVSWDKNGQPERVVGTVREITARKETELALKESEQRYLEVYKNTSDGIFLVDITPEGRFCYAGCNPELEKLVGSLSSRINGKFPEELFPPEVSPILNGNYRRCVETGGRIVYAQELLLPVGLRHFETTLIPVRNSDGNIYRIIGISEDITEKLKAEEAVKMEERRLRSLVYISQMKTSSLQELIDYALEEAVAFSGSRMGYIFFYNEETQEFTLFNWSQTAVDECMILNPPVKYSLERIGIWGEVVRQRKPIIINEFPADNPLKKGYPKGHVNVLRFMTLPVFKDDKIVAVIGVANKETDYREVDLRELNLLIDSLWKVVEIRKAEQALTTSMTMYQEIFHMTNSLVFLLDIEEFIILEANPAAQGLFGYTLEELKDMNFAALSSLEHQEACNIIKEDIAEAYRGSSRTRRGMGKKKNGDLIPVWVHISIIPTKDRDVVLAVITDLSEEVGLQQEREKAARYEAQAMKMTTMNVMSAGVVHEISQPLNALKFLADGMLYRYELGRDINILEALDTIKKISLQAERINNIIRHMRTLSNSAQSDSIASYDLNTAVSGAMKILGQQLSSHGIQVELKLANNIAQVRGQKEQLEEIIINLIVNAMHALDEHRQEDKWIECRTYQKDNQVIMEVADNGPGISAEMGSQIWEPFFTTRKGGKGMGLGLIIVQSIIANQGGSITHYNNAAGGASFIITLPAYSQEDLQNHQV